jgi:hypothetical protein
MWLVAAVTFVSGVIVAMRMTEPAISPLDTIPLAREPGRFHFNGRHSQSPVK